MASPLFPRFFGRQAAARQQQQATEKFQQTPLGKAVSRLGRRYGGNVPSGELKRLVDDYCRTNADEVTRYGSNAFFNWIKKTGGGIVQILGALIRPGGKALAKPIQELQAAQHLLESFGYRVEQPELVREPLGPPKPPRTPRPEVRTGRRQPTEPRPDVEAGDSELPPPERPLIEGMIPVTSSNVHSIGYEWHSTTSKTGNLLVRFLGGSGKARAGAGSLYRYKDVPRSVFAAFKLAASKGRFVWDELRVRGTVSGHQYAYELAGTSENGYIPRQAGLKRGHQGEWYMTRRFQGRESRLPERAVRGRGRPLTNWERIQELRLRAGRRRPT